MNFVKPGFAFRDSLKCVNAQGYFSNFDYTDEVISSLRKGNKKVVFIIGDSFVEGVSSTASYNNTFAQILVQELSDSFVICPFGIAGTDPLDYRLRAEKFIPELKPDICIVVFCGSNDKMVMERVVVPNIPMWYVTNSCEVLSDPTGTGHPFPTPDSMYKYWTSFEPKNYAIPILRPLCKASKTISALYSFVADKKPAAYKVVADTNQITYRHLKAIEQVCKQNRCAFMVDFVPDMKKINTSTIDYQRRYNALFLDLMPLVHFPLNLAISDYMLNDGHFNDSGNMKFADFLKRDIVNAR